MPRYGRSYSNWATGIGAGVVALLAVLHLRLKAWQAKRAAQAAGATKATGGKGESTGSTTGSGPRWTSSTTHEGTNSRTAGGASFTPPPQAPPTIKVEVIRNEPKPQPALGAAPLAIGPAPIRKENMGSKFALLDAAQEFSMAGAKYRPENAHGLAPDFDQLGEVIGYLARGIKLYAGRIDQEEPVDKAVNDALFDLFNGMTKLIDVATEIGPLFRQVHERDIERGERPRRNEHRWNA